MKTLCNLLRVNQWYKNLVVFLPLVFSRSFLDLGTVLVSLAGFVVLCILSSGNYILNDLFDRERDMANPEKKSRPVASGKVKPKQALLLFAVLFLSAFSASWILGRSFFFIISAFFLVSTLYTLVLKKVIFADIISISVNFLLRAISGAFLIDVTISPWLVTGVFFFALFLALGKRYGEICYLGKRSTRHRPVLRFYTREMIHSLLNMVMAVLVLTFALYSFSSDYPGLVWELPLFLYLVLRYYYLILEDNEVVRHPEKVFADRPLLAGTIAFVLITIIAILL